jgi:hypothetical protein
VARIEENRNAYRVLVGKLEGDSPEEIGVDGWIKIERTVIGWGLD